MNSPFSRSALGVALLLMVLTGGAADAPKPPAAKAAEEPIDWNRARELHRRAQSGEKLSPADQVYYDRARRLREQGGGNANPPAAQRKSDAPARSFTPLTELGAGRYQGEDGGLYGGGRNEPPKELAAAAQKETAKIRPLDSNGKPAASGKVVLLSIGMSNTTQEFSRFKQAADSDPQKSSALVIVDGAQGGQDAPRIADDSAKFWSVIDERLQAAGVTRQQVQVVWIKQAIAGANKAFPAEVERLQGHLATIVNLSRQRYPNLRIAYLSSRIYAGYATGALNPEPHAYESAFAVRRLIQQQDRGDAKLNYDPAKGTVTAPLLLWGPYLWGDGAKARKSDGLVWELDDFGPDGTHPSNSGRQKVAEQLLNFFKTDAQTRAWFLKKGKE